MLGQTQINKMESWAIAVIVVVVVAAVGVGLGVGLALGLSDGSSEQSSTASVTASMNPGTTATPTPTPDEPIEPTPEPTIPVDLPIPNVQRTAGLLGTGAVGNAGQGDFVALSGDGTTMAVGGTRDDGNTGAVWVFVRSGETWVQQGTKLVGSGGIGNTRQARTLGLSFDGNTLAVGGEENDSNKGAVWVFVRSGTVWTQQGASLFPSDTTGSTPRFGRSLALSDDGNTLAASGYTDDDGVGGTWVFTRSGSVWSQQGLKLVGVGTTTSQPRNGQYVALSPDGNTLAASVPNDNSEGGVFVFTRSGAVWSQQGGKLLGTGGVGNGQQGGSLALSSDGNLLASGASGDNANLGATWVFERTGAVWNQLGDKIVGTGGSGTVLQGAAVAIEDDLLVSSGRFDSSLRGSVWFFERVGDAWVQFGDKVEPTGTTGSLVQFGLSLAMTRDRTVLAVGAPSNDSDVGGTWIFGPEE